MDNTPENMPVDESRTYALTNGRGKSLSNVGPSPANKRGVDMSIKMVSPDARMPASTPVK